MQSPEAETRPVVLDVFAGAGGTALGFVQAGFRVLGALEWDESAAATYEHNIKAPVYQADVREVAPHELRQKLGLGPGELDVLIGCPPCQGFSSLRNDAGADDERNSLVLSYLDSVEAFAPRFAFFENVPGLVRSSHGRLFFGALLNGLREMGYGVAEQVLNAADYGVPQKRKRIIVLAGRDGYVPPFPWATHAAPGSTAVKHGFRAPWRTVRDAIAGYPPEPGSPEYENHVASQLGDRVSEFIRAVPVDGGSRTDVPEELWLACHLGHTGHRDVYGRLEWDRPSNTITTGCSNPSKGRFVHPTLNRGITLREAAALQGFPDSFKFLGSDIARQIGNAVPPPLAKAVAEVLVEKIEVRMGRASSVA